MLDYLQYFYKYFLDLRINIVAYFSEGYVVLYFLLPVEEIKNPREVAHKKCSNFKVLIVVKMQIFLS